MRWQRCAATCCAQRAGRYLKLNLLLGVQAARDALAALRCDVLRAKSWARAGDALGALGCRQLARLSYEQVSSSQDSARVVLCIHRHEAVGWSGQAHRAGCSPCPASAVLCSAHSGNRSCQTSLSLRLVREWRC